MPCRTRAIADDIFDLVPLGVKSRRSADRRGRRGVDSSWSRSPYSTNRATGPKHSRAAQRSSADALRSCERHRAERGSPARPGAPAPPYRLPRAPPDRRAADSGQQRVCDALCQQHLGTDLRQPSCHVDLQLRAPCADRHEDQPWLRARSGPRIQISSRPSPPRSQDYGACSAPAVITSGFTCSTSSIRTWDRDAAIGQGDAPRTIP